MQSFDYLIIDYFRLSLEKHQYLGIFSNIMSYKCAFGSYDKDVRFEILVKSVQVMMGRYSEHPLPNSLKSISTNFSMEKTKKVYAKNFIVL